MRVTQIGSLKRCSIKCLNQMFVKGLLISAMSSLALGISLRHHEQAGQAMTLNGDLNLPISLHVGQVKLKENHDDESCPYLAL